MTDAPPSNEVLAEMLRNIRDESLPSLHGKIDRVNETIAKAMVEIDDLKEFKNQHEGELRGMKKVAAGIISVLTLGLGYVTFKK